MGQTLTHGVYLPSEGERNCYNGLASNWRLLDGAIGTVAAHTTAIAGKADISHAHGNITNDGKVGTTANLPLITGTGGAVQAGSFGNQANTFCEGNDSRLSDARTPVAHTHTKRDVTDLFNSANTWSEVNTFSKNQIFQTGAYFYNSDSTAATSSLNLRNSKVTKGGTSDSGSQIIQFLDKDNKFLSQVTTTKALSGTTQLQFTLGNIGSGNNSINGTIQYSLAIDGTKQFIPGSNGTHDLGNSSYKWKTFNGINPGALSLPDISKYDNVTSQVQPPTGESVINLQGGANTWTASADGYLVYMGRYNHFSQVYLYVAGTYIGAQMSTDANSAPLYRFVSVPVCKNQVVQIQVYGTQFNSVYFYPNLGNV